MKNITILSGAGISAESGLKTFRDMGGLWESYAIEEVATPEAWKKNPKLVLDFYNERRKQAHVAKPNAGHKALVKLEKYFKVNIITQNVDGLHEKAGSSNVIHLHGELSKVRSEKNEYLVTEIGEKAINIGDLAADGSQLRPHIVWFGEQVPLIEIAYMISASADLLIIVGTSLQVYPAAGLVQYLRSGVPIYVVDPNADQMTIHSKNVKIYNDTAVKALPTLVDELIENFA